MTWGMLETCGRMFGQTSHPRFNIEARLSVQVLCEWGALSAGEYCSHPQHPSRSCLIVSGMRVGGLHTGGFSRAPCIERLHCSDDDKWCRLLHDQPVSSLLERGRSLIDPSLTPASGSAPGFLLEANLSHAAQVRATIDVYYTSEYVVLMGPW